MDRDQRVRHAVAVALEVQQTGERDTRGVLDEAIERPGHWHQQRTLLCSDFGDAVWQLAVGDLAPQHLTAILQPVVARRRHGLAQPVPRIAHVFSTWNPPCRRPGCRLGLERVVASHGAKARVDALLLAAAYPVLLRMALSSLASSQRRYKKRAANVTARPSTRVYYMHPGHFGQWEESGRDQVHSTPGISLAGDVMEMAGNQGDDLYGLCNNRFLSARRVRGAHQPAGRERQALRHAVRA